MSENSREQGFVSLLTAILISMLLLVITVSLISLEAFQLRKAEDAEQTLRAYYAAEAGVEDAVAKVLSGAVTTPTTGCPSSTIGPASGDAAWTCQQITFTGSPSGKLTGPPEESAITVAPGNIPNINSAMIEWHQGSQAAAYYDAWTGLTCSAAGCDFPSSNGYLAGPPGPFAPPLEVSVVEYPDGGFNSNAVCKSYTGGAWQPGGCTVKVQNALFVPGGNLGGTVNYNTGPSLTGIGPQRANCAAAPRVAPQASAYNCFMIINGLNSANDYLFRLRTRYLSSSYRMTFWTGNNAGGTQIDVPDGMIHIDVTAHAGNAYRRVIYQLPRNNSAANSLNFVIYSDTDVCKNFDVINDQPQAGYPCP